MNWTLPLTLVGRVTLGILSDFGRFSRFVAESGRALADLRTWPGPNAGPGFFAGTGRTLYEPWMAARRRSGRTPRRARRFCA